MDSEHTPEASEANSNSSSVEDLRHIAFEGLPARLGFVETEAASELREQAAAAMQRDDPEWRELLGTFMDLGRDQTDLLDGEEHTKAQLGLNIAIAQIYAAGHRYDAAGTAIMDAQTLATNADLTDCKPQLFLELTYLRTLINPDYPPTDIDLTTDEILRRCKGYLSTEDIYELEDMDPESLLGALYGLLPQEGIEDVEDFLARRDILPQ
jgi:hypothetical protein